MVFFIIDIVSIPVYSIFNTICSYCPGTVIEEVNVNVPLQAPINGNQVEVGSSDWSIVNIVYNSLDTIYNFIWPGTVIDSSITSSSTTSSSEEVIDSSITSSDNFRDIIEELNGPGNGEGVIDSSITAPSLEPVGAYRFAVPKYVNKDSGFPHKFFINIRSQEIGVTRIGSLPEESEYIYHYKGINSGLQRIAEEISTLRENSSLSLRDHLSIVNKLESYYNHGLQLAYLDYHCLMYTEVTGLARGQEPYESISSDDHFHYLGDDRSDFLKKFTKARRAEESASEAVFESFRAEEFNPFSNFNQRKALVQARVDYFKVCHSIMSNNKVFLETELGEQVLN